MSSSFTSFKGMGFWCSDSLLEIWLQRLYEALRTSPDTATREFSERARVQATAGMHGCISLELDATQDTVRTEIERAADRIAAEVQTNPQLLSARHLNALGLSGGGVLFTVDIPPHDIVALSRVVVALLRGRIPWTAGDKEALPAHWLDGEADLPGGVRAGDRRGPNE